MKAKYRIYKVHADGTRGYGEPFEEELGKAMELAVKEYNIRNNTEVCLQTMDESTSGEWRVVTITPQSERK